MKFLIDAQLPSSLALLLIDKGHDAIHTLSLPQKNFSPDSVINTISIEEKRIVITKDSDFYHSFLIKGEPYKVLLIRVGNMRKSDLNQLVMTNLQTILQFFEEGYMVELTQNAIKLLK